MPSPKASQQFQAIDPRDLDKVSGGSSRVSSRASGNDAQLTAMLTSITDSIKGLATQNQGGMDPMMMMMMGGGGGGGAAPAAAAAAAPAPPPMPIVNVSVKRY